MNLPATLFVFGSDWLWLGNIIFLLLVRALSLARWRELLDNNIRVNALVGLLFGISAIWQVCAGIRPGFSFHLDGATLFLLMFGWPIALITLSLVMLGTWIITHQDLTTLGVNGLMMLVIPMLFSEGLLRFSQRYLPKNPFLFVLLNGFVCAACAILLMMSVTALLLLAMSHYTWPEISHHYFVSAPALMYAEAFVTGAMITAFAVSQPEAVKNFCEVEYSVQRT